MGILAWVVLGLLAGVLAKFIAPGKAPHGFIVTMLLGIAGAMLGGFVATSLGLGDISGFDLRSLAIAIGGAVIILVIYHLVFGKK